METASTNSSNTLPSVVDSLRSMADQHHAIAKEYEQLADAHYTRSNELEEIANRQVRIESDPQFLQRIQEAEDQVVGDELLMEMQEHQQAPKARRAPVRRGVHHNPNSAPSTSPPNMRH